MFPGQNARCSSQSKINLLPARWPASQVFREVGTKRGGQRKGVSEGGEGDKISFLDLEEKKSLEECLNPPMPSNDRK